MYGYLLDDTIYSFELTYKDQHTEVIYASETRKNKEPTGTFTLTKENADGSAKIAGVTYKVWSEDKTYNQTHETSNAGQIKIEGLKLRKIFLPRTTECRGLFIR